MTGADGRTRCAWAGTDPLMVAYHDDEWGVPHHDDGALFELLVLEGAQAGLSWSTILRKREGYRDAFAGFDIERVARFGDRDVTRLLGDAGIVRNRQKIDAAIDNARAVLDLREQTGGSLDEYLWSYVDGAPVVNEPTEMSQIPAVTETSTRLSKDLRKRGFRFVGPTTVYAFMQATGMVDDHVVDCFVRTG
ncbi:MAG TPA: DNA-3-methyladenine glycosylase I [Acidimicrobiia bacterium]